MKDNILFGNPFDRKWYDKPVEFPCALEPDFKQIPQGDATEIGERGISLSGGQKARISLARGVYSKHDILLLESCFEAVDEHVGDHIWKNCFMDLLRTTEGGAKTVLCVTHALKRLQEVDKIIVMDDGKIAAQGTFNEISSAGDAIFEELLESVRRQHKAGTATEDQSSESAADGTEESQNGNSRKKLEKQDSLKSQGSAKGKKKKKREQEIKGNDLTGKEEHGVGQVSAVVYWNYIQSAGGLFMVFLILLAYTCKTALDFLGTRWLAYWSSHTSKALKLSLSSMFDLETAGRFVHEEFSRLGSELSHYFSREVTDNNPHSVSFYLGIYGTLSVTNLFFIVTSVAALLYSSYRASRKMPADLIYKIARAKMSFFDTTSSGRILNRFSKDIYTLDEVLPYTFSSFLGTTFAVLGTVFSISYVAPKFLIALPFLAVFYRFIQKYYIASSRELKRWDSVLRSPIYSFFTETIEGTSTIRAYGRQHAFTAKNYYQVDRNQRAYYLSVAANRWFAVRLEFIGTFLVVSASSFIVLRKDVIDPALAGLALTYALSITQTLNWTVRMFSDLEMNIVSVERITDYIKIDSEAPEVVEKKLERSWPTHGEIKFVGLKARYRDGLPLVLKGLTFTIKPGEKVGIVGRTGAGKSSLFLVLMRIVEPAAGRIYIDDVDLQTLGLLQLRRGVAIIPQDPVMFSGTLRQNLDPMHCYSDEQMMEALRLCHLSDHLAEITKEAERTTSKPFYYLHLFLMLCFIAKYPNLEIEIAESRSNLSFGQRQLLCIARAVLRRCKVLLLDEATSGIDLATDSLVQDTIRLQFQDCTVLTVAHRIETILGGDRVLGTSHK